MKKLKNVLVTLLSVLMMLTLFVGCSDNSAEESDVLGYVSFSDGGGSRSLETENETLYGVEDLYWAYTAEKIRGNYTTGQSAVATSYDISGWETDQVTDGKVAKSCNDGTTLLYLTPVKSGPAKGLKDVQVGPFSVGQWRIKLYGFKSYNALASNPDGSKGAFTEIVYKGTTGALPWIKSWKDETTRKADDIVSIDRRTDESTQPVKTLVFALDGDTNGKAELAFKSITMTVPEDQEFYGKEYGSLVTDVDPAVRVLVVDLKNTDSTGVPALIAVSSTDIKFVESDGTVNNELKLESGKVVTTNNDGNALNSFSFVLENNNYGKKGTASPQLDVNQFDDGIADLAFITLYKDSFTVGQNPYTMTGPNTDGTVWKGRYEYTNSDKWVTNGDIPESLKTFLNWAGDKYIQPDGSVKATTGAAGEEALVQGYALVGNISAYQVGFTSGVRTILGGDLNDLFGAKGETEKPKFGTAVAKITWKEAEAGQPVDKYNPYAQPGTAVYDVDAVGKTFTLYDSVEKAFYAYKTYYSATEADNHISADAPYVELLANIDTKDDVKFKGVDTTGADVVIDIDIPVLTGKYFVDGLTIPKTATGKLILIPAYDKTKTGAERYTSGQYTFAGNTTEDVVIKNFQFKDNKIWLYTDVATATSFTNGVKVTLDSKNSDTSCAPVSVYHSGVASEVNIINLGNAEATASTSAIGYFLGTRTDSAAPDAAVTSIGTLNVIKGRVEIGGRATVNKLVSAPATAGDVVLKARENAVVQSYGYGTADADNVVTASTMYRTWNASAVAPATKITDLVFNGDAEKADALKGGFKAISLSGNGATKTGSTSDPLDAAVPYWLYGIEGLPVKLPAFTSLTAWTAPAPAVAGTGNFCFMHWSSKTTPESFTPDDVNEWGKRYENEGEVKPGIHPETGAAAETITLYPQWAQPLGGRVFYLASTFDVDSYHFYGVANGSVNELTEWYSAYSSTDTGACIGKLDSAYYYSTTSTNYDEVLVAYATRPAEPSDSVTLKFSVFGAGTFAWDNTGYTPANPTAVPPTDESGPVSVSTETGIGKGKSNSTKAETAITASGLLWDVVKNNVGEYGVSAADRTITDWFVGSVAEHTELFKICDLYRLNRMWSSEQGTTTTGTTPFYTHALCWNVSKGKWEDAPKTGGCSFIPMRSIPSNPTP